MSALRKVHLCLGCVFAPLLLLFALSGVWQCFQWHREPKAGDYVPPAIVRHLSSIHQYQTWSGESSLSTWVPLRWFVLAMAIGLVVTAVLGIVMALQLRRPRRLVWLCLAAGVALPVLLLCI